MPKTIKTCQGRKFSGDLEEHSLVELFNFLIMKGYISKFIYMDSLTDITINMLTFTSAFAVLSVDLLNIGVADSRPQADVL